MKAALVCMLVAACGSSQSDVDTTTYVNKPQGYNLQVPHDWKVSTADGMSKFSLPTLRGHSILVRIADRPVTLGEGKPATNEALFGLTERVLKDLPQSKLATTTVVTGSELPGMQFDLTFLPHGRATRYHREHALLVGKSHLYHVIYSAPVGEAIQWDAYNVIVHSLSEGA